MAKVLVVDDEPDYRSQLKSLLTAEGYQVETAEDGVRAIELARAFRPDVLVADWMLRSSRHGIQVCESLRHTLPSLVTILITGYPTEQLRADAARAAVFAFLEKPFEADELRDAVKRVDQHTADVCVEGCHRVNFEVAHLLRRQPHWIIRAQNFAQGVLMIERD
ncbi:MAG: response regulator, partial [Phycisphaerae bacterium]|nr:response regulator [Phycisphaerae bacterium]